MAAAYIGQCPVTGCCIDDISDRDDLANHLRVSHPILVREESTAAVIDRLIGPRPDGQSGRHHLDSDLDNLR